MNERPLRVRIDRILLHHVDASRVRELPGLVADHLRRPSPPDVGDDRPIPRAGRAMIEAAAGRIAREVRAKLPPP